MQLRIKHHLFYVNYFVIFYYELKLYPSICIYVMYDLYVIMKLTILYSRVSASTESLFSESRDTRRERLKHFLIVTR